MTPVNRLLVVTSHPVMKVGWASGPAATSVDHVPGDLLSVGNASQTDEPDAIGRQRRPDIQEHERVGSRVPPHGHERRGASVAQNPGWALLVNMR